MFLLNQIYLLLALFFSSFIGIVFMIWRKMYLLQNGQSVVEENISFDVPFINEIKPIIVRGIKKYGHMTLVGVIRIYVKSSNFLRKKYEEIKIKIKNIHYRKNINGDLTEKTEVSKFLKIVSEYKCKIREIKQKIHEEENGL